MKNKFMTKLLCFVITIMMIIPTGIAFASVSVEDVDVESFAPISLYISADDSSDIGTNLDVVSTNHNAIPGYNTTLLDLSISENVDAVNAFANSKENYELHPDVGYANIGTSNGGGGDGAWMYKEATDANGVTHNAFFTSQYITARVSTNWCAYIGGGIYFTVTDGLTVDDKDITFIVEYLDNGETDITLKYVNQGFVDGSDRASTTDVAIPRTNTGLWKQAVVQVEDAKIAAGLTKTALADKTAQIKIGSNGKDTYISKLYIMKTSEYTKATDPNYIALVDAVDNITVDAEVEATGTLTLPTIDGAVIDWQSSNTNVITISNGVPAITADSVLEKEVTLTATITKDGYELVKQFTVTVLPLSTGMYDQADALAFVNDITNITADFALPTVGAGYEVVWESSDDSLIAISPDCTTALVMTDGTVTGSCELTAKVYMEGDYTVWAEKKYTATVKAIYQLALGTEIVIGSSTSEDVISGAISFDGFTSLYKLDEPEDVTGQNLMYQSPSTADYDSMRVQAGPVDDTRWAAYTTTYYWPSRPDRGSMVSGNIPFNIEAFNKDINTITFEVDYLDNGTGNLAMRYTTSVDADGKKGGTIPSNTTVSIARTNTNEWKTWTFTLTNAVFDNDSYTGLGFSDLADVRFEGSDYYISRVCAYTSSSYAAINNALSVVTLDGVTDENGVDVAANDITANFELPTAIDGFDGFDVKWTSADDSIISVSGSTATVYLAEDTKQTVELTATVIKDGNFAEKTFTVTLAKKPKTEVIVTDTPVITGEGTANANVQFTLEHGNAILGEEVTLIVASKGSSDEILAITTVTKTVDSDIFPIDATVDNTVGELVYYIVDANGASLINVGPGAVNNFNVFSTTKGINVVWDAPYDDYNFISKYVLYDENGNVIAEINGEDDLNYPVLVNEGETKYFALEGFDHAGVSTGKTEVKSGTLFDATGLTVKLYDISGVDSNPDMFNDLSSNPNTDNHSHQKVMTDVETGESLLCYHSLNRTAGTCGCGYACTRTGSTFLYFRPDGTVVTKDTQEVAVIVKYFDYGTGTINIQYNNLNNKVNGGQGSGATSIPLTGTNTFKTAVLKITDAGFYSPSTLSNADIRFYGGYNSEVYIAELTMMPLANYVD